MSLATSTVSPAGSASAISKTCDHTVGSSAASGWLLVTVPEACLSQTSRPS